MREGEECKIVKIDLNKRKHGKIVKINLNK